MRKNTTLLRVLLSLLLVVTLCLAACAMMSFALMKDILSNNNNIMRSGVLNIDFEVRQVDGTYLSVSKNNIPVLNYDKWEAGYTQVLNARIVNAGNLSLAYEFEVLADGIVEAMLNNEPLLSDVIEVYYAADEVLMDTRAAFEAAVAANQVKHLGNLTQLLLSRTVLKDVLHPSDAGVHNAASADYVTFVFKMHDEVPLRYQGLTVGDESFQFNLYANQNTHEVDSFDDQYDIGKVTNYIFDDGQTHDVEVSVVLTPTCTVTDCVVVEGAGTVVNIYGGHYDAGNKDCAVWVKDGAVVNIYGGTFFCDGLGKPATALEHQTLIYAGEGGTVNVYGGYFASRTDGTWLLDEKDGSGSITVYGGTYKDWNPADNVSEGEHTNYLSSGTSVLASVKGDTTFYSINNAENALYIDKEGDVALVGDLTIMDVALFHNADVTVPTEINGNGYTVELVLYPDNPQLGKGGYYPYLSTVFSSTNGSKVTVNDITFTGTSHLISAGDYRPEARSTAVTEFNNVNITDLEVIQFSKWCTALNTCATVTLNDCKIYGTKRSSLDSNYSNPDAAPTYDLVVSNSSHTYVNGGELGKVYLDNSGFLEIMDTKCDTLFTEARASAYLKVGGNAYVKKIKVEIRKDANVYIEDNAVVEVLDVTAITKANVDHIQVQSTATVKQVVDGANVFSSVQDWLDWKATT